MKKNYWICPKCNRWNKKSTNIKIQATNFIGRRCEYCNYINKKIL